MLKAPMFVTWGTGTNSERRTAPTLFSTEPFSCPEAGLQNA